MSDDIIPTISDIETVATGQLIVTVSGNENVSIPLYTNVVMLPKSKFRLLKLPFPNPAPFFPSMAPLELRQDHSKRKPELSLRCYSKKSAIIKDECHFTTFTDSPFPFFPSLNFQL